MRIEEAVKTVEKTLREKGYSVTREVEDGDQVLVVQLGDRKAKVRFHGEAGELLELHLKYENVPGVTILKCERYLESMRCIEDLLSRL